MRRAFVKIQCPTNPAFAFRGDTRSCPDPLLETHLVAPIDGESILLLECALLGPLRAYALLGLGEIDGGGQVRHPVVVLSSVVACGSVWDLSFLRPCLNFQQPSITSKRSVTTRQSYEGLQSTSVSRSGSSSVVPLRPWFLHFPRPLRIRRAVVCRRAVAALCFEPLNLHVEAAAPPRIQNPNLSKSNKKHLSDFQTATHQELSRLEVLAVLASRRFATLAVHRRLSPSIAVHPQGSKSKPAGVGGHRRPSLSPLRHFATLASSSSRGPLAWLSSVRRRGALGAFDQGGDTHAHGRRRAALSWAEPVPTAEAGAPTANSVETSG